MNAAAKRGCLTNMKSIVSSITKRARIASNHTLSGRARQPSGAPLSAAQTL
jgi:hypothetical protein